MPGILQTTNGVIDTTAGVGSTSAIPDSGLLHNWDVRNATSADTIPNSEGSLELTSNGSPTIVSDGLNGNQMVQLDGVDDVYEASDATTAAPYEFFMVWKVLEDGSTNSQFTTSSNSGNHPRFGWNGNQSNYVLDAGNIIDGGSFVSGGLLARSLIDGINSEIAVDRTVVASGDAGSNSIGSTLAIGAYPTSVNTNYIYANLGHVLLYDPSASGYDRTAVKDYINSEWGV